MVVLSVGSVRVSSRGRFSHVRSSNVPQNEVGSFYTVFGGGFPMAHFKSLSQAREVAEKRKKYLAFMLKKDRNKLFKQKK